MKGGNTKRVKCEIKILKNKKCIGTICYEEGEPDKETCCKFCNKLSGCLYVCKHLIRKE